MTEPLTPHAAQVRLAQYGERAKSYGSGIEKALYEIALTLSAEVDRLRTELAKYVGHEPTLAEETAYLKAAFDKTTAFIGERAEYITAIENCGPDNHADYDRWQGHAEARRNLAQTLGLPVAWPAVRKPDAGRAE